MQIKDRLEYSLEYFNDTNQEFNPIDMTLKLAIVPVTPFEQNCSIVFCEKTKEAAVVDPGGDLEKIEDALSKLNVKLSKVLLTHGHLDHCAGAKELAKKWQVPIEGPHPLEKFWLDQLPEQTVRFGFGEAEPFEPDRWLLDGGSRNSIHRILSPSSAIYLMLVYRVDQPLRMSCRSS